MSKRKLIFLFLFILISGNILAQLPPVFNADRSHQKEQQVREFLPPVRILWKSDNSILNAENLLQKGNDQAGLNSKGLFTMNSFNYAIVTVFTKYFFNNCLECFLLKSGRHWNNTPK